MVGVGSYNGNTCAAHSPSLRSNFAHGLGGRPLSALTPRNTLSRTPTHIFLRLRRRSPTSAQLGTRHGAANEPERSRRAPKKIVSPVDSWVWRLGKNSCKKTRLGGGTLLRVPLCQGNKTTTHSISNSYARRPNGSVDERAAGPVRLLWYMQIVW